MQRSLIVIITLLPFLYVSASGAISRDDFFAQYEPAARRVEDFYRALTMEAEQARTRLGADRKTETTVHEKLRMYANRDRLRVDTSITRDGKAQDLVSVVTPEKSFGVAREGDGASFILRSISRDPAKSENVLRNRNHAVFAPFSAGLGGESILQRLKSPTTTITDIREETKNGEALVTVSYRYPLPNPLSPKPQPAGEAHGSFTLAKDRGWVAVNSEWWPGASEEGRLSGTMEYGDTVDGIPLLRKVEFLQEMFGHELKWIELEVTKIVPGPAPQRDFKLAAFGIRDVSEEQETNYWLYLIVTGVVLIAAAIVVARVSARRRSA